MIKYAASDPSKNGFVDFLRNYGMFLAIGVAVLVALIVIIIILLQRKNKIEPVKPEVSYSKDDVYEALGGKENVINHYKNGSRIVVELKDYSLINEEKLNQSGVNSIIKMSNKITLVVKSDPESFYKLFN